MKGIVTLNLAALADALRQFGVHLVKGLIYTLFAITVVWVCFELLTLPPNPVCKVVRK